jgi:succinate dehydrogenase/fumarate reductase flavoprotein subunit
MELALERFSEIKEDMKRMSADSPHELMRAMEVHVIHDCAMMAAKASLFREESRWGLYHHRVDYPKRDDANWFVHCHLKKADNGDMVSYKKPVEPYIVPLDEDDKDAYQRMRIAKQPAEKSEEQAAVVTE